jgi:hypothetical protein
VLISGIDSLGFNLHMLYEFKVQYRIYPYQNFASRLNTIVVRNLILTFAAKHGGRGQHIINMIAKIATAGAMEEEEDRSITLFSIM